MTQHQTTLYVIGPDTDTIRRIARHQGYHPREIVPITNATQLRGLHVTAYQVGYPIRDTFSEELMYMQRRGQITVIDGLPTRDQPET